MVELEDVRSAIRDLSDQNLTDLSDRNPANFMKDYLRSNARNRNWPSRISSCGFTAKQRTGDGQCFEFVPLNPGDDPFPEDFLPTGNEAEAIVQTLSLPIATREIVRNDEQSLAQIAVKLFMIEQLFASSIDAMGWGLTQVQHLQNNVKLRSTEIDAIYQATIRSGTGTEIGAIAVEVKIGDPIISEQLGKQTEAVLSDPAFAFCVPTILKRVKKGEVQASHLGILRRNDIQNQNAEDVLGQVKHALRFRFEPDLPNI